MIMTELLINTVSGERTQVSLSDEHIQIRENFKQNIQPSLDVEKLRQKRNELLAETDYLGLPDLGGFSAEMTAYRQALRDLPANTADPANPVWPTKPGGES